MDFLDEEILSVWKSFYSNSVKHILIGGFATNLHGFHRTTGDLDVWLENSLENRQRLRKSFKELGLGDLEELETMEFLPGWTSFRLNSGFELDIMTRIKGFDETQFNDCYALAPIAHLFDIPIKFLHINHLIEAKKASGREKDLIDIIALEKLRDLTI